MKDYVARFNGQLIYGSLEQMENMCKAGLISCFTRNEGMNASYVLVATIFYIELKYIFFFIEKFYS